jgi:hypothetical protein
MKTSLSILSWRSQRLGGLFLQYYRFRKSQKIQVYLLSIQNLPNHHQQEVSLIWDVPLYHQTDHHNHLPN